MKMKFLKFALVCALVGVILTAKTLEVRAAPFVPGNLVVVRVGDGSATLSSAATPVFLLEYTLSGTLVQTIPLPTTISGNHRRLTLSGTATSEGHLTLSANGQYLTMVGYDAPIGQAAIVSTFATTNNRVVARIDMNGNIDTTTALSDAYNGNNARSAVSTDGINIWLAGNGGAGQGASAAVRYTTLGSTTSVQLHSTNTNTRVVNIYNGQLYVSQSTGAFLGVSTVGAGLPTTGNQALVQLPGTWTSGTHSVYDFWFKDPTTLYMADDGTAANLGGIQKWTFDGANWSLQYTLLNNGSTTTPCRGLAGYVNDEGYAVLFATTGGSLITITDTGANATSTVIASAPANTAFRGVEYLVPEPSVYGLVGLGLLVFAVFRRSRK